MLLLKVENVSKSIGGVMANDNVTIEVEKGTITGVIGPNGSGKSTLFQSINGFGRIDKGEIYLNGIPISRKKPFKIARMGIASTFQQAQLFAGMTLEESVLLGAYCHESKKAKALAIAAEKIDFVGLTAHKQSMVKLLNAFERKKAELAAALAIQPQLLLLDELFAGLVPAEVEEMLVLVKRIQKECNVTLLIIEHVPQVIIQLCGKVYVMQSGKVAAVGTVEEMTQNAEVIRIYLGEDYGISECCKFKR